MDAVIAAQAFHWFANRAACEEIHRVLKPSGTFGIIWSQEDLSVPWTKDLYVFMDTLHEQNGLVFPYQENWKILRSRIFDKLFHPPKEDSSYKQFFPSSIEGAYNYLSSHSVVSGGSERNKKDFKEYFDSVMEKHFKADGIPFQHVPLQLYMYWFTKEA